MTKAEKLFQQYKIRHKSQVSFLLDLISKPRQLSKIRLG